MGFIKKIFNHNTVNREPLINWVMIDGIDNMTEIIDRSKNSTLIIFKHSTRCGISGSVLSKFEKKTRTTLTEKKIFYLINVNKNRDVSNEIEKRFGVRHESPQVLILKNNEVIRHVSHYSILDIELVDY
ncbi:MAG: bacillithiol system redox-active protein YtxJ [Flavobacteriaceae bacterium]|nr:bacillithiol system redox-active protein YtxJ [Flavobacteriaceae bacterium]